MSLATATFRTAHGSRSAKRMTLLKVEIASPAVTLYFSEGEVWAGGFLWQKGITGEVLIREASPFLGTGPDLATTSITLDANRYSATLGGTIAESLATHQWQGAAISVYRWDRSLTSFASHAFRVFYGRVNRPVPEGAALTLHCMQGRTWNQKVPTTAVDKISYPNSPEVGSGAMIPVVYGSFLALPLRSPWSSAYASKQAFEDLGGGAGAVPGVLTDPGYGSNNVRVTFADHAVKTLNNNRTGGLTQFIVGGNQLDPMGGATTFSLAGPSYMEIDDDTLLASHGVVCTDVYTGASTATPNTAESPRNCMDVFDETTSSRVNQNTSAGRLFLVNPQPSMLGLAAGIEFYVAYKGNAANANNLRLFAFDPVTLTAGTIHSFAATSGTPTWTSYPDFSTLYANWQTAGDGVSPTFATIGTCMDFAAGTTNQADVYALGIVFLYRPQRSLVVPSTTSRVATSAIDPATGRRVQVGEGIGDNWITTVRPGLFQLDAKFYGHIEGYPDVGGAYTGTGTDLIERPADIIRHLLVTYGDQHVTNDFETGATAFGSFVYHRTLMRRGSASDYVLACFINQESNVQTVAQRIAQQSFSLMFRDSSDDKWKIVPWDVDKPIDYTAYTLDKGALLGRIKQDPLSDVGIRQNIRVPWYHDHFRGRSLFSANVGTDTSTRGYNQPTYQDQQAFVVDGTNDKIDWTTSGTPYTETLAHATYATPIDLAAQVQTQLRVHGTINRVGWGFSIKAGHNSGIGVRVPTAGVNYTVTMAAGEYSPETLAVEAARALNAAATGRTFSVTYDHSTNKFTVSATGGSFDIRAVGGTDADVRGWAALGFDEDYTAITSQVAQQPRYAEKFWINSGIGTSVFLFRWASGANTANGAHTLLGFDVADTTTAQDESADYRRNNRESRAAASAATWGEAEALTLPSDYIRQEETAIMYRDRNADLRRQPRMRIQFSTTRMPDIQRGMVFGTAADLDDLDPFSRYGSDGSWASKKFMVLEVHRHCVTSHHDEIVAIEVTKD